MFLINTTLAVFSFLEFLSSNSVTPFWWDILEKLQKVWTFGKSTHPSGRCSKLPEGQTFTTIKTIFTCSWPKQKQTLLTHCIAMQCYSYFPKFFFFSVMCDAAALTLKLKIWVDGFLACAIHFCRLLWSTAPYKITSEKFFVPT